MIICFARSLESCSRGGTMQAKPGTRFKRNKSFVICWAQAWGAGAIILCNFMELDGASRQIPTPPTPLLVEEKNLFLNMVLKNCPIILRSKSSSLHSFTKTTDAGRTTKLIVWEVYNRWAPPSSKPP